MKKIFSILIGLLLSVNCVFATELPKDVEKYIKTAFPKATVRFDGLVTLPDGTMYLPLFPSLSPKGKPFGIKYSAPKNTEIRHKPDLLIFNNNFALIKLIKQKDGGYKVYFQESYPTEVITSILPQDLLVPRGLILPDSLESVMGDLVVPTTSAISYAKVATPTTTKKNSTTSPVIKKEEKIVQANTALKNKIFFIANSGSKTIKIVHSNEVEPTFTFKLSNVPQDIIASPDSQYLFVISHGQNLLDVIDIKREQIVKQIDLTAQPTELLLSKDGKLLFVASEVGNSIFVVDVKDMTLTKKIKVMGAPRCLTFNEDYSKIYYFDKLSANIYDLTITEKKFVNTEIMNCPNVSSLLLIGKDLFVISRTRNKLITYSLEINEVISELDLPEKPVDMIYSNGKIHILCAKDNQIVVVNGKTGEMDKIVNLWSKGFARNINRVGNSYIMLVSDSKAGFYNVYDAKEEKIIQKNKLKVPVSVITIIDNMGIDKL